MKGKDRKVRKVKAAAAVTYVDLPFYVRFKEPMLCSNGDQREAIVMAVKGNFCGRCWAYYGEMPRKATP